MCSSEILQRGTVQAETATVRCFMKSCRRQALSAFSANSTIELVASATDFTGNLLLFILWYTTKCCK